MKYTFQDSTDLPVQKDFIKDLQHFIKISIEAIPLENAARLLNDKKKNKTIAVDNKKKALEEFENRFNNMIGNISSDIGSLGLEDVKDEMIIAMKSISSKKYAEMDKELAEHIKAADYEIEQLNSKIISILDSFFEESIYDSKHSYSFMQQEEYISGKQISSCKNMDYWFELDFKTNKLKVKDLYPKFSLPMWVSGGILHREDKVKRMDISNYIIASMEYSGKNLEAVIMDDGPDRSFRIFADENTFMIFHNEHDITVDEELSKAILDDEVLILLKKMKQYFSVAIQSRKLTYVFIDGKNAIEENLVFNCLKLIASKYGELINECIEKGYNSNEITIKIEQPDGTRTEKYIVKEEMLKQLSAIGSEGMELAALMHIPES